MTSGMGSIEAEECGEGGGESAEGICAAGKWSTIREEGSGGETVVSGSPRGESGRSSSGGEAEGEGKEPGVNVI